MSQSVISDPASNVVVSREETENLLNSKVLCIFKAMLALNFEERTELKMTRKQARVMFRYSV